MRKSDGVEGRSNVLMYNNQQLYHLGSPRHNGDVLDTVCVEESKDKEVLPSPVNGGADAPQSAIPLVSTREETG